MFESCPHLCFNKTSDGRCRTTTCINPYFQFDMLYGKRKITAPNPCQNCSNNPVNGGSGICFCTLGGVVIY